MSTYYDPPSALTPPSLTSDELAALQGPSTTEHYLSFVPSNQSDISATCQAHGAAVGETVEAFGYYNASANFGLVKAGMTIWIGSSPGGNDVGMFRLRKDPAGGNLYIGYMGASDTGLGAIRLKYYYIEEGFYVTVWLLDENLWSVMPRIDYVSPTSFTIYEDYDKSYDGSTAAPEMVLCPGPHMAAWADSTGYATFSITPKAYPFVLTSTYPQTFTWTLPSAATLISGSLTHTYSGSIISGEITDVAITFKLPPGFYVLKFVGTITGMGTSNPYAGTTRTSESWRYIWVHDEVNYPPTRISAITQDSRDPTGRRVTMELPGAQLGNWRELSISHYWQRTTWNGTTVPTATTCFTGWIVHSESTGQAVNNGFTTASVEMVGPSVMLDMLPATSHSLNWPASGLTFDATTWTEVMATYCTPEFMAWYILRNRAGNFLKLFDFYSFSVWTNAFDFTTPGVDTERGSILQQLKTLLTRVLLEIGWDSTGAAWIRQDPSMIKYPDREDNDKVRKRATLDETMCSELIAPKDVFAKRRRVMAEGFYRDGTTSVPVRSAAPDLVNSQGIQEDNLQRLLVLSQFHVNGIAGLHAARLNNPFPDMQVTLPGNWDVFEPAHWSWITLNLPSYAYARGAAFFRKGIISSMSKVALDNGAMETRLTIRAETIGRDGETVIVGDKINPPPPPPPPPPSDGFDWIITEDYKNVASYGWSGAAGMSIVYTLGVGWTCIWYELLSRLVPVNNVGSVLKQVEVTYLLTNYPAGLPSPGAFQNRTTFGGSNKQPLVNAIGTTVIHTGVGVETELLYLTAFSVGLYGNDTATHDGISTIEKIVYKGTGPTPIIS